MAVKLLKQRWQKIAAISIGALAVLLLLAALLINHYWSPVLGKKLSEAVEKGTDGLYHIDYGNAELHVLRGEVVLYDITLRPDTLVYRSKKHDGNAPNDLYKLHVNRLVVSHIHPFTLYFKKKLNITRITLNEPKLEVDHLNQRDTDKGKKDKRTLWQKISKKLELIHVGEIYFNDVNLKYRNFTGPKPELSEIKELDFKATDLLIDSATQYDRTRLLFCSDIVTDVHNYTGRSPNGKYSYAFKSASFSTRSSRLKVTGFKMQPIGVQAFFKNSQQDRFTIRLDTIEANGFDLMTYRKSGSFRSSQLSIIDGSFSIYSNPNGAKKSSDRIVTFPQYGLSHFKSMIHIDTMRLKRINVYYNEFNHKSNQPGYVAFLNTSGRLLNITNNPDSLKKNNIAKAAITSYFMGRGLLDLKFRFNLTDLQSSYSYNGHLGTFNLPVINAATMPLAMVKVTSGKVKSFDFDINSTSKVSTGKVTLLYNDLRISMLKPDTVKVYKKKGLASFFVNALIIKHDNPDDGEQVPRTANVRFERPSNFPFLKPYGKPYLAV